MLQPAEQALDHLEGRALLSDEKPQASESHPVSSGGSCRYGSGRFSELPRALSPLREWPCRSEHQGVDMASRHSSALLNSRF